MTSTAVPETTPLNEVDAGFVHFEQPGKWWSIHAEFHLTGRMDPERLLSAARDACARHPMMRARKAPHQPGDRAYRWEIQAHVGTPELEVVNCVEGRAESLSLVRERILQCPPQVDCAPPFKLWLLRHPEGDALFLYLAHAISDGLGVWRFVTSVFRSYAGLEDPMSVADPLSLRELRSLAVPGTRRERLRRLSKLPAVLVKSKPVRLAPDGGGGEGEGACLISFDEREMAALQDRRRGASTLNDVLLAGYVLAIRRWNIEHGARAGRVSVTMPVNLRPASWGGEVIGNMSSFVPVSIRKRGPNALEELVARVTKRTQKAKRDHTAPALLDLLLMLLGRLSVSRKQRMGLRDPQVLETLQDTSVFSNMGRLELPDLGGEVAVRGVWFTGPAGFTRGFTVAVLSFEGRLQLGFRYQRAHFDDDAAAAFAALYRSVLLAEDGDPASEPGYSSTTSASPSLTA